jgi:hypothetical protein
MHFFNSNKRKKRSEKHSSEIEPLLDFNETVKKKNSSQIIQIIKVINYR